jgi:hypothetical protein
MMSWLIIYMLLALATFLFIDNMNMTYGKIHDALIVLGTVLWPWFWLLFVIILISRWNKHHE